MGYLLLFLLILQLLFIYTFNGKNIISPSFIACGMFIISAAGYTLAEKTYFQYQISSLPVATILMLIMCIFAGEITSNHVKLRRKTVYMQIDGAINISKVTCLFLSVFILLISLIYFYNVYRFSLTVGNIRGNLFTMAAYVRYAKLHRDISFDSGMILSQCGVLSECLFYFFLYAYLVNRLLFNKNPKMYLLPIICYLPHILAADDRINLLRMIAISCIIIFCVIKHSSGWKKEGNFRIIRIAVLAIVLFVVSFRLLGYRTKVSREDNLVSGIYMYISGSIAGFDIFLRQGATPNVLFGQGTLKGIYNILRQWGLPIPVVPSFENFYSLSCGNGNTYTAFKAYIHDYSLIGAVCAMFLWGTIITSFKNIIRRNGISFPRVCVLGMLFYPVVMISIADVTGTILSISTVYRLVYIYLIDYFFVKRKLRIVIKR